MEIGIICLLAVKGFLIWKRVGKAERAAYVVMSLLAAAAMIAALISPNAVGLLDLLTGGR